MNARIAAAFLMLMSSTGCIFLYPGGGGGTGGGAGGSGGSSGTNGNVTFTWSFSGQTCSQAGVSTVQITVDGESLVNNGVFNCLTDNYPGIQLNNFRPRTYTYSIVARNSASQAVYETAGNFTVNGDIRVTVDLDPVVSSTSYAYLQWRFPANSASTNPTCSQAGIANVYVSIDGAAQYSVSCTVGTSNPGSQTSALTVGNHTIDLTAVDSTGYAYYSKRSTLTVTASPTVSTYNLDWAVGGAAVSWTLVDGSISKTCSQAGITNVTVNFQDTTSGTLLYGSSGDSQPCSAGVIVYDFLTPGRYKVIIDGYGSGGSRYTTNTTLGAPEITITAGVFKSTSDATATVMYRVQ